MDNLQAAVFERMRQVVGRLIRDGAGDALDGKIVLTVRDGNLESVVLPDASGRGAFPVEEIATAESLLDEAWKPDESVFEEPLQPIKPRKPKSNA